MDRSQFQLEVFFDGLCPLCKREIQWLMKKDRSENIKWIDIAEPEFDPEPYGKSFDELMAKLHARKNDGTWLIGVPAFQEMYYLAGLKKLAWLTKLPIVNGITRLGYRIFAANRLRFTGRSTLQSCRLKESDDCSVTSR